MAYNHKALNDATIVIPSADLRSIVLSAIGVAQDNGTAVLPDGTLPQTNNAGITLGGLSIAQWLLFGAAAFFLLRKK